MQSTQTQADAQVPAPHAPPRALVMTLEQGHEAPHGTRDLVEGVLSGRWVLVDRFEQDGRRFLVARERGAARGVAALSPREREVVTCALRGLSNKAMAYDLALTESTVATHLRRAMAKLGVSSRTELITSLPLGLGPEPGP
ncbi:hypothetical protein JY651_43585 [Pyxidicoccus parkwayensis]|uniref:HTH luxR-type domain-containing protein n=1 Tax=Pyxidicoccus parkwayensis TaxID=2813578 RepID=A0ABX7NSW1_9BACT|nr:helix-turn-helix transcriptional regulator [Pyxidicoccus parkwaysis]QSQ21957.1 hypothetical protein JY651_43585 [Pyxidicoccus parkwaysis]